MLIFGGIQSPSFQFNNSGFILTLIIFSLPFSIFIYAINDYHDQSSDSVNPRKGTIFGERHNASSKKYLFLWGTSGLIVSLALSIFVSPAVLIILSILAILTYLYSSSLGHFKSVPAIDTLVGGGLYFYLTMIVGYLAFQTGSINIPAIFSAPFILVFCIGIVGQLMGTVIDEIPDKKSNMNTSAVFFGSNKIITFSLLAIIYALFLARNNWIFVLFLTLLFIVCFLGYLEKFRKSFLLQIFGGAFLPIIFFITTIMLYVIDPNLLKI